MHALLVLAQFLLAAGLVLSARWWPPDALALTLAAPGAAIAVWAWVVMGLTRLRVMPSPREHAALITRGPYRWIRHPMYTGLLWLTAALLLAGFAWWRLGAWLALAAVLEVKAREEERLLAERFPEYRDYCRRTSRFLPGF